MVDVLVERNERDRSYSFCCRDIFGNFREVLDENGQPLRFFDWQLRNYSTMQEAHRVQEALRRAP